MIFFVFLSGGFILSDCTKQKEKVEKAVTPEPLTDPIKIDAGYISGTLIGDVDNPIKVYRGIPYAAPPVCDLRMHGGGYFSGSGKDAMTNLHRLTRHGVVFVNVTMRINTFGLLAHPLLTAESPDNSSGNYMFLDMIAALKWVKRNISAFGGDPENVTIFGESGGGAKVSTLMASPLAKGLFHKAICKSGTAIGAILNSVRKRFSLSFRASSALLLMTIKRKNRQHAI